GLLSGLTPARQAWGMDPHQALKGQSVGVVRGRRWAVRDLLLPAQVALCCVLVMACFVSLRGLQRALSTPLGFEARGVAIAGFDLTLAHYSQTEAQNFQRRALEAVSHIPGVAAAAYANSVPLSIDQSSTTVYPEQTADFRPSRGKQAAYYDVSPGYFAAI